MDILLNNELLVMKCYTEVKTVSQIVYLWLSFYFI